MFRIADSVEFSLLGCQSSKIRAHYLYMRWILATLIFLPWVVHAQTAPTPTTTYAVTARVTQVIDDEVDGISYLRARLTILDVVNQPVPEGSPVLGPGTTLSAIVRDSKLRSILRSANPSLGLQMALGWYDESTYEVLSVLAQSAQTPTVTSTSAVGQVFSNNAQLFLLLAGVVVLAVVTLRLLQHPQSHERR